MKERKTPRLTATFVVSDAPTCKYDRVSVVGASRGESVDIVCEIESDPPAKSYRWKFNNSGETLDVAAERYARTSNGTSSLLRYTPVTELDYGSLSCWAANSVGHQINPCVFQVVAAGKPYPVKNCTLSNLTSSSVEVFCLAGFDGGLPQYFVLELYSTSSAIPRYNMTSLTEPFFFLDNLEPDVTFRIVIFAVNSKGKSNGIVLEEVTFKDAEKRTATDGDLSFSPLLGVLLGGTLTVVVVIMLVIIRIRKSKGHKQDNIEQKVSSGTMQHNTMSSTKPLLRSTSPKDADDPDIIPAKYGSPEGRTLPHGTTGAGLLATSPNYAQSNVPQWIGPVDQYHQYNNPVARVGTFPRDSRPKDLHLENGNNSPTKKSTNDMELNGLAIKERLMANRLPESCV
ncbi:unnamed protein product [Brassicogethes aeneus]|uniref:Nephrin n=1 Tax=Brassicogethes aeneus TaxID=1431903 RepID=A0A9P0AZE9_BRAAE|nr:unnamed protein product [Brassicogethes aeneus]